MSKFDIDENIKEKIKPKKLLKLLKKKNQLIYQKIRTDIKKKLGKFKRFKSSQRNRKGAND